MVGMVSKYAYFDIKGKVLTDHSVGHSDCKNITTFDALSKFYFNEFY